MCLVVFFTCFGFYFYSCANISLCLSFCCLHCAMANKYVHYWKFSSVFSVRNCQSWNDAAALCEESWCVKSTSTFERRLRLLFCPRLIKAVSAIWRIKLRELAPSHSCIKHASAAINCRVYSRSALGLERRSYIVELRVPTTKFLLPCEILTALSLRIFGSFRSRLTRLIEMSFGFVESNKSCSFNGCF